MVLNFSQIVRNMFSRQNQGGGRLRHRRPETRWSQAAEFLEQRVALSGTITTLNFNIPADVAAQGVEIGFYGTALKPNPAPNPDPKYLLGPEIYLKGTPDNLSWGKVSDVSQTTLPLVSWISVVLVTML
jgi:hypothetical protein